jgi:hypothetical protein
VSSLPTRIIEYPDAFVIFSLSIIRQHHTRLMCARLSDTPPVTLPVALPVALPK